NDASSGAGEGIWSTPAIDRRLGLLFVGTGQNLGPPPGPLEDAVLAIDVRTGKLRWAHQFFTNDVFSAGHPGGYDYDFGASPNLWTVRGRTLVGDGEKSGTYEALDAATGRLVWQRSLVAGGSFGGLLGSAAYVDGRLVVSANVGKSNPKASKILALDPATGATRWSDDLTGDVLGPISAVPGVAFVGTDQDEMVAIDTATGGQLWRYDAPGPVASGPSIVDGRVLWGYGFTLFSGPGPGGILNFAVRR
ncbi:MAG TPA: PQQ-binding-like beta-propeller repeat protein, partial [Acidimicrobiia bacterium]|nr:PQQ-binding-like beta-propeller repeat protein [Acidimicrobiia bacterium]